MTWKKLNDCVEMWDEVSYSGEKKVDIVMALSVDKSSENPYFGVVRQITKREGSPDKPGFVDKSRLIIVSSKDLLNWKKVGNLKIKRINKIIKELETKDSFFIGLEDPDIIIDEKGLRHLYFTIALKLKAKPEYYVYLGHAHGKDLNSLEAISPLLSPISKRRIYGFKEICFDLSKKEKHLAECGVVKEKRDISAIASVSSVGYDKNWKFSKIVFDPHKSKYKWCNGHASPCCFFLDEFLKYKNMKVGIMNGREKSKIINGKKIYGKFRPGLFIYDDKKEKIVWVDSKPLLEDPQSTGITFASDFIYLGKREGILYAHINDSFIRAYKLKADLLKNRLPK